MRLMIVRVAMIAVVTVLTGLPGPMPVGAGPEGGDKDITFIDTLFSVTMAGPSKIWTCGFNGAIYHSDDGGEKWVKQESGTPKTLLDIVFLDDKTGIACGQGGTILRTGDGGQKWETMKVPSNIALLKVSFSDAQIGCAVGDQGMVVHTSDGGITWEEAEIEEEIVTDEPEDSEENLLLEGEGSEKEFILYGVSLADRNVGYAVGEFSTFMKTNDGGKTWTMRSIAEAGGKSLFCVLARSTENVWVAGIDGILLSSEDGGHSWRRTDLPVQKHLFSLKFYGKNGYMVGKEGIYLRSTDEGNSWELIDIGAKFYLQDVVLSESCGWIIGAHGWMLKTPDEGKSFQIVRSAPSGVSFIRAR